MADEQRLKNCLRDYRSARGWSQDEVARRSGLSRAGVSAIEVGRLVPSTAAALALAAAFECRVEDLFQIPSSDPGAPSWAWSPPMEPCRYWHAQVGGRLLLYPVEVTPLGAVPHDGVHPAGTRVDGPGADPRKTLVMASCDPAAGLLAAELQRTAGIRLIVLPRSSGVALDLLSEGLIHAAGVHLGRAGEQGSNGLAVKARLGTGFSLLRVARWEEGIALSPGLAIGSVRGALRSAVRWVGRETGSGARQCLDDLLGSRPAPRRLARDHRGVAEAIRCGWADAGVCLRLAGEEAGLRFLSVRHEAYDLCYSDSTQGDPRLQALQEAVRSRPYRRLLGDLPGYDPTETGALERVR